MNAYEQAYSYADYLALQLSVEGHRKDEVAPEIYAAYVEYLFLAQADRYLTEPVLDLGCNTGGGLLALKAAGFSNISGMDLKPENVKACEDLGFQSVFIADFQTTDFTSEQFKTIICTHVLEHMYWPTKAVQTCHKLLQPDGIFMVVLPYPDGDSPGHLGSVELGTCQALGMAHSTPYDDGASVRAFFSNLGFKVTHWRYDTRREPEIWLLLQKATSCN